MSAQISFKAEGRLVQDDGDWYIETQPGKLLTLGAVLALLVGSRVRISIQPSGEEEE